MKSVHRHPVLPAKPLRKLVVFALATLLAVLATHGALAAPARATARSPRR